MMLMDHRRQREIARRMGEASGEYPSSGSSAALIATMGEYVRHVTEHLWKENNRLFVMAQARL